MKHRKLEKKRGELGGLSAVAVGCLLLAPLIIWLTLWSLNSFERETLLKSSWLWGILSVGGTVSVFAGLRDRYRSRFIGEIETFVLGAPVFGETLSAMCVIPARRDIQITGASGLLYWDEFAVYQNHTAREIKRHRILVTDHHAGDGTFKAGDVLRHEIPLLLPTTPPEVMYDADWRVAYKVSLVLQLSVNIDKCPDVREEYEVAVLEEHGM